MVEYCRRRPGAVIRCREPLGPLLAVLVCVSLFARPGMARAEPETSPRSFMAIDTGRHHTRVNRLLFTPDGRHLISVSCDKTIRFWQADTGRLIRTLWYPGGPGDSGRIFSAAISADGQRLAIGAFGDNERHHPILLISLRSGEVERIFEGHPTATINLAFSSDYEWLASTCTDPDVRVWHVPTGKCRWILNGHTDDVYGLAWSPGDQRLLTGSFDRTACIWNVPRAGELDQCDTRTEPDVRLTGHTDRIMDVDWSGDGRQLATAGTDGAIRLWNPRGKLLRKLDSPGKLSLSSIAFTPDFREIQYTTAAAWPLIAGLRNATTGEQRVTVSYHFNTILDGAVSPDGRLAATGDSDGTIAVWNTSDGTPVWRSTAGLSSVLMPLWSQDGRAIRVGRLPQVKPEETASSKTKPVPSASKRNAPPVNRMGIFDLTTLQFGSLPTRTGFAPSGAVAEGLTIEAVRRNTLRVQRECGLTTDIRTFHQHDRIHNWTVLDDDRIAVATMFGLFLFDSRTGKLLRRFKGHYGEVPGVARSPQGRYLLSSSNDRTLRVWSPDRDAPLLTLYFNDDQWAAWTPDGTYACSPGMAEVLGRCTSNGPDRFLTFTPVSPTTDTAHRPDLIRRVLWQSTTREVEQAETQLRLGKLIHKRSPTRAAKYLRRAATLAPDSEAGREALELLGRK